MSTRELFKVAIPNKGALSEAAVRILSDAGYRCQRHSRELVVRDSGHGVEFYFLRPRDIAVYVGSGLIQAGITGRDLACDSRAEVEECLPLNFGKSRFCYAAPAGRFRDPSDFAGRRIATSYPNIVQADLEKRGLKAEVIRLDGAVEISVALGVADLIADVVESGRTLVEAGLEIVGEPVLNSEAVVLQRRGAVQDGDLSLLLKRLQGILLAREYLLLEYVIPKSVVREACAITPGVKSPTLSPVSEADWVAVAAMVRQAQLNRIIDQLSEIGGKGIIAHEIRTCRL